MAETIDDERAEWLWEKVQSYQIEQFALLHLILEQNPSLWLRWYNNKDQLIEEYVKKERVE